MRSEIAQQMAFDTIRYSLVWEDWRLLQEGLAIEPGDDVLSVCSAGDNALALLLLEPNSVTAVDLNPAQTALLELKVAAIRVLDHPDFVALLGLRPHADRWGLFLRVREHLSPNAASFWDNSRETLVSGVADCGRLENYFAGFRNSVLPDVVPDGAVDNLLMSESIDEQREIFSSDFDTPAFREAFSQYFGRENMAKNGRDPAQFQHVEEGDAGAYFLERFTYACLELPLQGNFYVEQFLTGRHSDFESAPTYLRPQNYDQLKGLVGRLRVVTGEIEQLLRSEPTQSFNKANFSDIFEYMTENLSDALFGTIADTFRSGGRIAYWNLLVPRYRPEAVTDRLRRLSTLSNALWKRDRSWFYRAFHVEEIV